jgi:phage baseplate assembly protein W
MGINIYSPVPANNGVATVKKTSNKEILGRDIKLSEWDIVITDGDLELVSGVDCLKQDLVYAFLTPLFYWGMEPDYGSRLAEFVEGGADDLYLSNLKRAVYEVFDKEPRVKRKSAKVELYRVADGIEIENEFLPIDEATSESMLIVIENGGA